MWATVEAIFSIYLLNISLDLGFIFEVKLINYELI